MPLNEQQIKKNNKNINEIIFLVQGSAPDPYRVMFKKTISKLTASCTCPAGEYGLHCKHRIRIMSGDSTGIVSKNIDAVSEVQSWFHGTDTEKILCDLSEAEQQLEKIKKRISANKKYLDQFMRKPKNSSKKAKGG